MKTETKTVEVCILTAEEGKVLTNGDAYSEVGGTVYLGINDSLDNWWEIDESEVPKEEEIEE